MTQRDLALLRLRSQQILHPALREPGEVVARLCALQAQDYAGALWSVGLRMPDAAADDIRRAIADHTIVRTWLLRGTLHFAAPEDVRWILELVGPRIIAGGAGRHRQLGLSKDDFARSRKILAEELDDGRQVTREEVFRLFAKGGISPAGQRGYHLLSMAGLHGLICFGPFRMNQPTFVLLDAWVPEAARPAGIQEALSRLAERYFSGHGPATLQDFAWWSGLTVSDTQKGLKAAGSRLAVLRAVGREYVMASGTGSVPGEPGVYLLPGFDEYIIGYRDRSAVLGPALADRKAVGSNGIIRPTVVIDGSVAGVWKRMTGKRGITLSVLPFSPMSPARRRQVAAAAERYGKFTGLPAVIDWQRDG